MRRRVVKVNDKMPSSAKSYGRVNKMVVVNDKMQSNYRYYRTAPVGRSFDPNFKPDLTPAEMLRLGAFGGRYMRDCKKEFPQSWFVKAKLHPAGKPGHSKELNYFKVDASQSLKVWRKKGWIYKDDPRGWFQWYCRYYLGRRLPKEDERQIKRWRAISRHIAQLTKNCPSTKLRASRSGGWCRPVQRQALLHWAYDSRKM